VVWLGAVGGGHLQGYLAHKTHLGSYQASTGSKPLPVERRLGIALEEAESFLSTEIRSLSDADPEVPRWGGAAKKVSTLLLLYCSQA